MARPKHRTAPGATYFVTTNTSERRAVFHKPEAAATLERKIIEYRDRGSYLLHAYVVMPDHLHVILTPGATTSLEKAMQLIKGGSSHEIGLKFPVWQAGFSEHQIRDREDLESHVRYIDANPVKACVASRVGEYPYCSASAKFELHAWPVASGAKAPGDVATEVRRG
ncbi:MAG: transposase [Acidobacteria bacterium]|nr:MAG: transposase [Acidobacteriota bacterium]